VILKSARNSRVLFSTCGPSQPALRPSRGPLSSLRFYFPCCPCARQNTLRGCLCVDAWVEPFCANIVPEPPATRPSNLSLERPLFKVPFLILRLFDPVPDPPRDSEEVSRNGNKLPLCSSAPPSLLFVFFSISGFSLRTEVSILPASIARKS